MKNLKENLLNVLESIDQIFVPAARGLFEERRSLLLFLFHVVFEDKKEMDWNCIDPQQRMTLEDYRRFIEYYLGRGYQFVSPDDVAAGLKPSGKYILVTFDDGYLNNQRLLPLMKEYKIPALFFIASNFVKLQKGFWWDIVWRERKKRGASERQIGLENDLLKTRTHYDVERYLKKTFGEKALFPVSDLDRPFTPRELEDFAREEYVFLGNHTKDHALLTLYPPKEIRAQIADAQNDICEMTGESPLAFSYPNGSYSETIVQQVKELGFKIGITSDFGKNFLPIPVHSDEAFRMKRFGFSSGRKITREGPLFCSDLSLFVAAKKLKHSLSQARNSKAQIRDR